MLFTIDNYNEWMNKKYINKIQNTDKIPVIPLFNMKPNNIGLINHEIRRQYQQVQH